MRQGEKPGKSKAETKRSVDRRSPKNDASGSRELEKHLAEALEQQRATSEILRVISSSPGDIQPVFDAIAANAARLCDAVNGLVIRFDGQLLHLAAHHNVDPERLAAVKQAYPRPPSRGALSGRAILTGAVVHVPDVSKDPEYTLPAATTIGYRSVLAVPMMHEGIARGTILVARDVVAPFSDTHIALIQTFADQAVIAIENARLFNETKEALEQQTATAEILRVISQSPAEVQPVFDAIVQSAATLCHAPDVIISIADRDALRLVASVGPVAASVRQSQIVRDGGLPLTRGSVSGRAFIDRRTIHVDDVSAMPDDDFPEGKALQRQYGGHGTTLAVPLLREDVALGVITLVRNEISPFTERQVALLESFANQAVIAIENVRLFTELEARNRDLTETLEQQTAAGEILRVISSSPTDIQPVLDTVAASANRLCESFDAAIYRRDGDRLLLTAHHGPIPIASTLPLIRGSVNGRAVLDGRTVHVADIQAAADEFPVASALTRGEGVHTHLSVPLTRDAVAIGTINLRRTKVQPFTERQIALLQTFADQAVIAIENVRLFTELEGRNRDLTATSEILRVISQSPTDVQPVFDTIVRSAVRLCDGLFSALHRFDGEMLHLVAHHNYSPEALEEVRRLYPARPSRGQGFGRAILDCAMVHIPDVEVDLEYQAQVLSRAIGFRSGIFVPMLRDGVPIGAIMVARAEAGPFSDSEMELLKTFADQAVIAVENVRLFKELEARTGELTQSVEKLTALGEVSRAVSSTLDVETVLDTIVARASELAGGAGCSIYEYDEGAEQFELRATHHDDTEFVEALRAAPLRKGEGLMGRATQIREPVQIPDITQAGAYQSGVRDTLIRFGYRALLAVPLLREDQIIGSLSLTRKAPGEYAPEVIDVLKSFATQSALAIQNARLFREIADKSAQLEAASRHKSEFLANMSHELRTPLNAIIGFSEILAERMFGDINEKQTEYLQDILESGRHLLSLINDILDLSKIEAGRMELERSDFDLPNALDNALILVRERASRRGIRLGSTVDPRLRMIGGDERKVKQVLLNLLSNALKFTPEGGRIDVGARVKGELAEVSVADTGIGIAPEDQDAVFEEFRQVGTADKKAEGTGLGLALSRKFIELHGGKIWVKSAVGVGSTFTFTLPLRG